MTTRKEIFAQLSGLDITPYTNEKQKLTYLGWAEVLYILKSVFENVDYRVIPYEDAQRVEHLFHPSGQGACVVVCLRVEGNEHTEVFPIMDKKMNSQGLFAVDSKSVNHSIKRALVKAAAHFGLGLSLYMKSTGLPKAAHVARALQPQAERFVEVGEKLAAVATLTELKALFKDMLGDEREEFKLQVKAKREGFANG